jgi:hypothetical protein
MARFTMNQLQIPRALTHPQGRQWLVNAVSSSAGLTVSVATAP